jgi:serine/threonine protein kinase
MADLLTNTSRAAVTNGGFLSAHAQIADFGLAAIRADPEELLRTECGTRSYMAPEILAHKEYDGAKADVWSAGVVLFIMLAGNPPFQIAKKVRRLLLLYILVAPAAEAPAPCSGQGDWWFNAVSEGDYDRFWRAHKRYASHFPLGAQVSTSRPCSY